MSCRLVGVAFATRVDAEPVQSDHNVCVFDGTLMIDGDVAPAIVIGVGSSIEAMAFRVASAVRIGVGSAIEAIAFRWSG